MTQHSYTGLRAYHARNPRASQLALSAKLAERRDGKAFAMLSVDAVLANLTDEQRAELATRIHPKSVNASAAAIKAQGFKEANARFARVTGSEHYAGRESFAAHLLANDKLSAEQIIECLSVSPSPKPIDPQAAADDRLDAARADMRAQLQDNAAGANASGDDDSLVANMRARWEHIHAEVARDRGL